MWGTEGRVQYKGGWQWVWWCDELRLSCPNILFIVRNLTGWYNKHVLNFFSDIRDEYKQAYQICLCFNILNKFRILHPTFNNCACVLIPYYGSKKLLKFIQTTFVVFVVNILQKMLTKEHKWFCKKIYCAYFKLKREDQDKW